MQKVKSGQTDIAIVGGGVGGCIAALALSSRYSVTLIDKNPTPVPKVGDNLPPAARRIFQKLNLTNMPDEEHLTSMGMASIWGSQEAQYSDPLRNPDSSGWHVDRQLLESSLRNELLKKGVQGWWPCQLVSSQKSGEDWRLTLSIKANDTRFLDAKLVIDATGRHCTFARQQGATRQQEDKLVSVWMTFQTLEQNQLAKLCSVESGWWYCAPVPRLPDDERSTNKDTSSRILSFQTDADLLPKDFIDKQVLWQAACELPQFAALLDKADERTVTHHGKVAANSSVLSHAGDGSWFAIGDAAMSFDPLSSQGMFNAMATGMQLADLILDKGIQTLASRDDIAAEYQQQLASIWHYYQQHKSHYYRQERRWVDSEFWKRRCV